jgi:Ca-activated chloride channel family protein
VRTKALFSRPTVTILEEPQLIYALLDFSPVEKYASRPNPPLNICLVIDRSTSMQGLRMDTVKAAAIELIRQLKPDDRLAIVLFSDRAEVLLSSGQEPQRKNIEAQIRMLSAGGGTEILQGIQAGFAEARRNATKSMINHIIMLTDGRTYGDEDECLNLANQIAKAGIRITGFGIGTEWNDTFLDDLTGRTGGNSYYISQVSDLHAFLQEKFISLNQIYAERVMFEFETAPDVELKSAFRLQPEATILTPDTPIRLGSIPKKERLSILLEFVISSVSENTTRLKLGSGGLNFILPSDPMAPQEIPLSLTRLTSDIPDSEPPPRPIFQALSQVTLFRMQEKARREVSEGKVQEASLRLQRLATQLLSIGENGLAETALMEAERIQRTHMLSAAGEKSMKYGTRSLLLPERIKEPSTV